MCADPAVIAALGKAVAGIIVAIGLVVLVWKGMR